MDFKAVRYNLGLVFFFIGLASTGIFSLVFLGGLIHNALNGNLEAGTIDAPTWWLESLRYSAASAGISLCICGILVEYGG